MSQNHEITRRRLITGGVATVSTAAMAIALASTAPATNANDIAADVAERDELMQLGDVLPDIEAEYLEATNARQQLINDWWHRWPIAPDSITSNGRYSGADDYERMFTGTAILPDRSVYEVPDPYHSDYVRPRAITKSGELVRAIDDLRRAMRRKRKDPFAPFNVFYLNHARGGTIDEHEAALAELHTIHADAVAYEAAKAQMLEQMDWEATDARADTARENLIQTVNAVLGAPASGLHGVVIKARAIAAYGRIPLCYRISNDIDHREWAGELGSEIVRIATAHLTA